MADKPAKPRKDFPLYAHAAGCWAKKINGKTYYFGKWDQPLRAEEKYRRERPYLEAGMKPPVEAKPVYLPPTANYGGMRLGDGLNIFLAAAKARVERGELGKRSWSDYESTANKVLGVISEAMAIDDIGPEMWMGLHATLSKDKAIATIAGDVTRIKVMMKWLVDNRHIDRPVYFGSEFKKPSKLRERRERASAKKRWFDAEEIRILLQEAKQPLQAMIWLGINCGFGNGDCGQLESKWLDMDLGWVSYPRPKTGVFRRCKLWPGTILSLREWIEIRPERKSPLLFVTKYGNPYSDPDSADCVISKQFQSLCEQLGMHIARRGFYGLRRTTETIGGECRDQVAVDHVMGHVDTSMAATYRQKISDERLEAVADTIWNWLFVGPQQP